MKNLKEALDRLAKMIPAQSGVPISPRSWLEFLGSELGCDWATYWKVNHKTQLLFPVATWHSVKVQAAGLEQRKKIDICNKTCRDSLLCSFVLEFRCFVLGGFYYAGIR